MKKYYIAYGSNLNIDDMSKRCPSSKIIDIITLFDYKLVFKGFNKGYLTIEESQDSYLPAVLYSLDEEDIKYLDYYEGYPNLYYKKDIIVEINNQEIISFIYIMNEEYDYQIPSNYYLNKVLKGYEYFNFDPLYLDSALEYSNKIKILTKKLEYDIIE